MEEEGGRYMNSQMTHYFHNINNSLSELMGNDDSMMWEELGIEEVAKLSPEQIEKDYTEYCLAVDESILTLKY